jgi:hypothetical protein
MVKKVVFAPAKANATVRAPRFSNRELSRGRAPMHATNRKLFLLITAFVEAATSLCLLFLPAVLFAVLLGLEHVTVETIFVGRIAGGALLGIGVASWMAAADTLMPAQLGLLSGILIYDAAASMLLAFAGAVLKMNGVLLWPAVGLHAVLAVWCFICLLPDNIARFSRR